MFRIDKIILCGIAQLKQAFRHAFNQHNFRWPKALNVSASSNLKPEVYSFVSERENRFVLHSAKSSLLPENCLH